MYVFHDTTNKRLYIFMVVFFVQRMCSKMFGGFFYKYKVYYCFLQYKNICVLLIEFIVKSKAYGELPLWSIQTNSKKQPLYQLAP